MDDIFAIALGVFLLAGTVKGGIGIGLPTTVIAIMALFVDPRVAVALGLMPIILSNLWQAHREGEWRKTFARFWPYAATLFVTLFLASNIAAKADGDTILLVTGIGVVVFAGASLIRRPPPVPPRWEVAAQLVAGVASGLMGGFTGLWAPPLVILLLSLRLDKRDFVRATGLLLFLGGIPLLAGYALGGLITREIFLWSLVMCVPTFIGFSLGERVRRRLDSDLFSKLVLVFFLLMGLNMIRRAVMG